MKNRPYSVTTSLGFDVQVKASIRRKSDPPAPARQDGGARILVVDEDPASRRLMMVRLGACKYQVKATNSARAALNSCARWRPHLVITALRMTPMDGFGLLRAVKSRWSDVSVIILTAYGTIPDAVAATQLGAFGFLVKPIEKADLLGQVQRAIAASPFTYNQGDWRAGIVSRSQLMEDRLGQANRAARSDLPVLLSGEGGTGKELFARAIHASSGRRGQRFIVVKCANRAVAALEAELFGDEMEICTGVRRPGECLFEAVRGGTLLLDEIGDLPFRLQVRLVTALREEGEFGRHSGGSAHCDVRLLCSTSGDLKRLLSIGRFYEELYHRISALSIEVPPLGRRREDIPLLVSCFLEQAVGEGGIGKIYSRQAMQLLATADWPGNVRQLFDLVRQNVALSQCGVMSEEFVEKSLGTGAAQLPSYDDARAQFSRDYLVQNLKSTSGNISNSARLAKRNRTHFYKLLTRYRLEPNAYKANRQRMPK
jgi:two-component system, NtrC family, response regulator GlrR